MAHENGVYAHLAGQLREAEDVLVDTPGAPVIGPVWQILEEAYQHFGALPTLLERDFNFPQMSELVSEIETIKKIQERY